MIKKVRKVGHYCPQIQKITVSTPNYAVFVSTSTGDEKHIPWTQCANAWKNSVNSMSLEEYEYQYTQYSHVDTLTNKYIFKGKPLKTKNVYFKNCKNLEFEEAAVKKQLLKMFDISTIVIPTAERDIFGEMESFVSSNIVAPIGPYLYGHLNDTKVVVNPFISWYSPTITLKDGAESSNLTTRGGNHLVLRPATNKWQLKQAIDLQELIK